MDLVIVCLLVSGCLCAPTTNSTTTSNSTTSSSSSVSNAVSTISGAGKNVIYSITQKFTFGSPNDTSIGKVLVTHTTLPIGVSTIAATSNQNLEAMRNRTQQQLAAMEQQQKAKMNMFSNIHNSIRASHAAIQASFRNMFKPFMPVPLFG